MIYLLVVCVILSCHVSPSDERRTLWLRFKAVIRARTGFTHD